MVYTVAFAFALQRERERERENAFPSFLRYLSAFHDDRSSIRLLLAFEALSSPLRTVQTREKTTRRTRVRTDFPSRRGFPSAFATSERAYLCANLSTRCEASLSRSVSFAANDREQIHGMLGHRLRRRVTAKEAVLRAKTEPVSADVGVPSWRFEGRA